MILCWYVVTAGNSCRKERSSYPKAQRTSKREFFSNGRAWPWTIENFKIPGCYIWFARDFWDQRGKGSQKKQKKRQPNCQGLCATSKGKTVKEVQWCAVCCMEFPSRVDLSRLKNTWMRLYSFSPNNTTVLRAWTDQSIIWTVKNDKPQTY